MTQTEPDSHARRIDEKWNAYPDTILEFDSRPPLRVDLRERLNDATRSALAAVGLVGAFGVFTAENPVGENAEDEPSPHAEARKERANDGRESRLERELRERGVSFVRVDCVSPDGAYREHGVASALARDGAIALARRFAQLALFWYDGRSFWLLPALAEKPARRLPIDSTQG